MFNARIRLDDKVEKFRYAKGRLIVVNEASRKKKLAALLRLLKQQKKTAEVKYITDKQGQLVAKVRCV